MLANRKRQTLSATHVPRAVSRTRGDVGSGGGCAHGSACVWRARPLPDSWTEKKVPGRIAAASHCILPKQGAVRVTALVETKDHNAQYPMISQL